MGTSTRKSFSVARKSPNRIKTFISEDPSQTKLVKNPETLSDIIIEVDDVKFALHKCSLSSKSGWMKRKIDSHGGADMIKLVLPDLPGGADAFTLVAKFCYGIKFEIDVTNVAMLRCAAEYLEMTEEYGKDVALVSNTENVLRDLVFTDLKSTIQVLCSCQTLLPVAEDLRIVSRCINTIACILCRSSSKGSLDRHGFSKLGDSNMNHEPEAITEWWADELLCLPIHFFQQVLQTIRSKGMQTGAIAGAVIHYALQFLKTLSSNARNDSEHLQEKVHLHDHHHHRIVLETIVNLLPAEKGLVPMGFLFRLLWASRILDTTIACQMDLERRIGAELDQTTLEDLVIHSSSCANGVLFDLDFVHRLVVTFVQKNDDDVGDEDGDIPISPHFHIGSDASNSGSEMMMRKVSKLVDTFLAEAAADPNLPASKFIKLSDAVPKSSRIDHDGIYRAVDVYLKAHPSISNTERKRICKVIDCQKLSQEACSHAAQNDRLPVHMIVQVLYLEQIRLHNALYNDVDNQNQLYIMAEHGTSDRIQSGTTSQVITPRDSYTSLRQENEELRLEVARMKSKLNDLEKGWISSKSDVDKTPKQKFLSLSIIRTISRMNPFGRKCRGSKQQESVVRTVRTRRNSVS